MFSFPVNRFSGLNARTCPKTPLSRLIEHEIERDKGHLEKAKPIARLRANRR